MHPDLEMLHVLVTKLWPNQAFSRPPETKRDRRVKNKKPNGILGLVWF